MPLRRCTTLFVLFLLMALLLAGCQSSVLAGFLPTQTLPPQASPTVTPQPSLTSSPTIQPGDTLAPTETAVPTGSAPPSQTADLPPSETPGPTPLPVALGLDPADWKDWPVLPIVPERARQIYMIGKALGNDPNAFSVFGDCQSEPQVFMGAFETDPPLFAGLPPNLQETVAWFAGSFNRKSPTAQSATTAGAELWPPWHKNQFTCATSESPLQCELRLHHPSFAIIQVGTHYEDRNQDYMRKILDQLIAAGVVPILATKADDSELDYHVNTQYAELAAEYDIPFWNFWAAVRDLPWHGLTNKPGLAFQGDIYLTASAVEIHRMTALQTLDIVRRAVGAGQ